MAVVLHDLRLISFILLCISSGLLADPRINLDSGDISPDFVRPHTNVELACNVHDLPGNRLDQDMVIEFQLAHSPIAQCAPTFKNTTSDRFKVRAHAHSTYYQVILTITNITQDEAGAYQCGLLISDSWEDGSNVIELRVMKLAPPEFPKCSYKKNRNRRVVFFCQAGNVVPQPTLTWQIGDVIESPKIAKVFQTYIINKTANMTDMDEPFVCKYSYFDGVAFEYRSCSTGKPQITVIAEGYQTYTTGDDVKLTMVASANPPMTKAMTCTWNYQQNNGRISIRYVGNDIVKIHLPDVQLVMNGTEIRCTGENPIGNTTKVHTLLIEKFKEDNLTASVTTDEVHLVEGQSTTFNCEIGFIPPSYHVNYNWYFQELATVDVRSFWWQGRFNETHNKKQLVLNSAKLEDNDKILSCRVHFNGTTLTSSKTKLKVYRNAIPDNVGEPCQLASKPNELVPFLGGAVCAIGTLLCLAFILKLVHCIISRSQKPSSNTVSNRTSSFASSASETQSESSNQLVNISERSGILKRSVSLPSSRGLPSIPPPMTLPPVHEYEKTPRNETYSFIKSHTADESINQQAYMDMAAGKMKIKPTASFSEEIPSATACSDATGDGQFSPLEAARGDAEPTADEWYVEAKRSPDMTVQYHDLEDLYRETATNNVYLPRKR